MSSIVSRAVQQRQPLPRPARFTVARDAHGGWAVCDRMGCVGGLFIDRASAIRFALGESDNEPGAVECVPDTVTLDFFALLDRQSPRRVPARKAA